MTMRGSAIARRSSSETFEQVNQMFSGREAGLRAREDLARRHRIAAEALLAHERSMARSPLAFIA